MTVKPYKIPSLRDKHAELERKLKEVLVSAEEVDKAEEVKPRNKRKK